MLLQGNDGHDCDCAIPRCLVESLIITAELELEHLVPMKNSGGTSVWNPVEHNVGNCSFGTHTLNVPWLESMKKVEDEIKQAKRIKKSQLEMCMIKA